jgi:uncharacterized membrane protein
LAVAAGWLALVTVVRALNGALDSRDFPEMLLIKVEALPTIFPLHMASGALALLLVPAALALSGGRWHKTVARLAAFVVVVAAVTAVPVALESPLTRATAAGFTAQAVLWLALLGAGVYAIRRGDVRRHRTCMLMMAAVTSGAMFFRVYLALWVALNGYAHFRTFYSCDAFAAWLTPLAGMSAWLRLKRPTAAPAARAISAPNS